MKISERALALQGLTVECLRLVRDTIDLPSERAEQMLIDLPDRLKQWQATIARPLGDAAVERVPLNEGYSLWAENYDNEPHNRVVIAEEQHIWELIGSVEGKRVLDVGCGTGRHCIRLAAAGADVLASEPNEAMLKVARSKAKASCVTIGWLGHDIESLPRDIGQFDLVLCCLVLSHVEDVHGAIGKLSQFVIDGGAIVISDFHPFNLMVGWRAGCSCNAEKKCVPNVLHLPSQYFEAMHGAGLAVESFKEVGDFPKLPKQPATIIMKGRKKTEVGHACGGTVNSEHPARSHS